MFEELTSDDYQPVVKAMMRFGDRSEKTKNNSPSSEVVEGLGEGLTYLFS